MQYEVFISLQANKPKKKKICIRGVFMLKITTGTLYLVAEIINTTINSIYPGKTIPSPK